MKKVKFVSLGLFILSVTFCSCGGSQSRTADNAIYESSTTTDDYKTSSGYSTDPNYKPTVSNNGDYHTIDGKRRQIQYQGSAEQKRDLDMIDEYMRNNPNF